MNEGKQEVDLEEGIIRKKEGSKDGRMKKWKVKNETKMGRKSDGKRKKESKR